jgi:hypothetical protein
MANIPPLTLESAVHLIQVALTPVFLLSGIAALLNVYSARLARVADRLDELTVEHDRNGTTAGQVACAEIARLHRRSLVLDTTVVLGTVGAAATCMAILTLFLLALGNIAIAGPLLALFGVAIVCTLGSVAVFGVEMLLSSRGLRMRMHLHLPSLARRR